MALSVPFALRRDSEWNCNTEPALGGHPDHTQFDDLLKAPNLTSSSTLYSSCFSFCSPNILTLPVRLISNQWHSSLQGQWGTTQSALLGYYLSASTDPTGYSGPVFSTVTAAAPVPAAPQLPASILFLPGSEKGRGSGGRDGGTERSYSRETSSWEQVTACLHLLWVPLSNPPLIQPISAIQQVHHSLFWLKTWTRCAYT